MMTPRQQKEPSLVIETKSEGSKATVAGWSGDGDYIIVGHDNGYVSKYDSKTGKLVTSFKPTVYIMKKNVSITDIQFAPEDRSYFITSSKDKTATLIDVDTFEILKVYKADAPMNTAAITVKDFVILGGGQEARNVTQLNHKVNLKPDFTIKF